MIRISLLSACLLAFAHAAAADTVVLRDRTVLEGSVSKSGSTLKVGGKSIPLDDVLLWEDGDGLAQFTASTADHIDGCAVLADRESLKRCTAAFAKATAAGNGALAWELLARASECGLDPAAEKKWTAQAAKAGAPGDTGDAKVPGVDVFCEILTARALSAYDDDQEKRTWELLRAALSTGVENEETIELLEEIAPKHWRVGDPYERRIWLDWHCDVIQDGMRAVGRNQPDIQRARQLWRDENRKQVKLWGAQTQEITFITRMSDSDIVSDYTKYARLTCKSLDVMFKTDTPQRDDNDPLVIWFFESRGEYLRVNTGASDGGNSLLAKSAGFYSSNTVTSNFFWIPGQPRSVRNTFVHELTHHWVDRRNPRANPRDLAVGGERAVVPGFWIVEGFATFIEEGHYDIRSGEWTHFNPKAAAIDIIADLSKQGKVMDWKKMFTLSQIDWRNPQKVEQTKRHAIVRKKWALRPQPTVEMRLFYDQSAATCHYLYWGDNGKYRDKLLDYVTNYYCARNDKCDIQTAFGISPEALGKAVEKWCLNVRNGWRPKNP